MNNCLGGGQCYKTSSDGGLLSFKYLSPDGYQTQKYTVRKQLNKNALVILFAMRMAVMLSFIR